MTGINIKHFNGMTPKLVEKFDHPFSHVFILVSIFSEGQGLITRSDCHKLEKFRLPSQIT